MTAMHPDQLLDRLTALPRGARHLVALAGPPGAGKSTLAEALVARLNEGSPARAAILAMDGYHFDDGVLSRRGMLARKGAPETFDVGGLAAMLHRLRANAEPEIAVPVFDRSVEIARAGAALIPKAIDIVLVEGNYLLLDQLPWNQLAPRFDLTALIRVSEAELRRRLTERWDAHGLNTAEARAKVDDNDLPNGLTVLSHSRMPDVVVDGTQVLTAT